MDWPTPTVAAKWKMTSTPSKHLAKPVRVAHISNDQLDLASKIVRAAVLMNLRGQIVQHANVVTRRQAGRLQGATPQSLRRR